MLYEFLENLNRSKKILVNHFSFEIQFLRTNFFYEWTRVYGKSQNKSERTNKHET